MTKLLLTKLRGIALYNIGEYEDAIVIFNEVILIYPEHFAVLYNKGLCLKKLGETNQSDKFLKEGEKFIKEGEKRNSEYKGGFIGKYEKSHVLVQIFK